MVEIGSSGSPTNAEARRSREQLRGPKSHAEIAAKADKRGVNLAVSKHAARLHSNDFFSNSSVEGSPSLDSRAFRECAQALSWWQRLLFEVPVS